MHARNVGRFGTKRDGFRGATPEVLIDANAPLLAAKKNVIREGIASRSHGFDAFLCDNGRDSHR